MPEGLPQQLRHLGTVQKAVQAVIEKDEAGRFVVRQAEQFASHHHSDRPVSSLLQNESLQGQMLALIVNEKDRRLPGRSHCTRQKYFEVKPGTTADAVRLCPLVVLVNLHRATTTAEEAEESHEISESMTSSSSDEATAQHASASLLYPEKLACFGGLSAIRFPLY